MNMNPNQNPSMHMNRPGTGNGPRSNPYGSMKDPETCRIELLAYIDEVTFILDDLTLYLDTHPTCKYALTEYEKYRDMRITALEEYTEKYGPLCRYDVKTENEWTWINQPWPWEGV